MIDQEADYLLIPNPPLLPHHHLQITLQIQHKQANTANKLMYLHMIASDHANMMQPTSCL